MEKLQWGILSTGWIADQGARAIQLLKEDIVIAVGSRSQESADAFGDKWNIPKRHGSYDALVNDPDVDVVYIGTPHPFHKDCALLALNAGKPVLLEKPFTLNARQAEEVIRLAREKKLFLMEAMWSRFVPGNVKLLELVNAGVIGDVQMMFVNLTLNQPYNPESRLYNLTMGGGALLDLGVYTVSYASYILGEPSSIQSHGVKAPSSVDEQNGMLLSYDKHGAIALLASAMRLPAPSEATLIGRKGSIRIHAPFYCPNVLTIDLPNRDSERIEIPFEGTGYNYQFAHVHECLQNNKTESPVMPLDETLQIMRTLDTVRAHWGLNYPNE